MPEPTLISNLPQLNDRLGQSEKGSKYDVEEADFSSPFINKFFYLLGQSKVELSGLDFEQKEDQISILGQTSILGVDDVHVKMLFSEDQRELLVNMDLTMPEDAITDLPGAPNFPIRKAIFHFQTDPEINVVGCHLEGELEVGESAIPVNLLFPTYEGDWLLSADLGSVANISLSQADLNKVVGDNELLGILPSEIKDFGSLSIEDVQMAFDPKAPNFSLFYILFRYKKDWRLFEDKIILKDLSLGFTVENPLSKSDRVIRSKMAGMTEIAGLGLEVYAGFPEAEFGLDLLKDQKIKIAAIINHFWPELKHLPNLYLSHLAIHGNLTDRSLNVEVEVNDVWKQQLGSVKLELENLRMGLNMDESGIGGEMSATLDFKGRHVFLSAELEDDLLISGRINKIALSEIIKELFPNQSIPLDYFDLDFEDVNLSISPQSKEFNFSGSSKNSATIPIGVDALEFDQIQFEISRIKKGTKFEISGFIKARLEFGTFGLDVRYDFPGDFILKAEIPELNLSAVIQDLCGADSLIGFPAPSAITNLKFQDVHVGIAPKQRSLSLGGNTDFGQGELQISRSASGKWGFLIGLAPPEKIPFSSIDPALSSLDELKFSQASFILASTRNTKVDLSVVKAPPGGITISKGLNFFADMDMSGLGVDELVGVKSLYVNAAIGNRPSNFFMEAALEGSIQLSETVSFGDMRFRLQPTPSNFSLAILGAITASINEDELIFLGGMEIRPLLRTAAFQAMMKGTWNEPFGFKNVAITDVAADIGLTIMPPPSPPLPVIGLAGSLKVGSIQGSAAVRFDSALPSKSMLAVEFEQLYLDDIIKTFCEPEVYKAIPKEITDTVLNAGLEEVDVYIVPQPTRIVDLYYDAGITIKGRLSIGDYDARAHINLDYSSGLLAEAEMDSIEIAGLFKLSGSKDQSHPMLLLDLRAGKKAVLEIAGSVFLLGMQAETRVSLSDTAFYFWLSAKIFDLFEASVEASGGKLGSDAEIYIKATMKNDLFSYLREEVTAAIQAAAEEATRQLTEAQDDLSAKQEEVNKLNGEIDRMRAIIQKERERDERNVRNARREVEDLQKEVRRLNGEIKKARDIIRAERKRDERNVRNARSKVNSAKRKVDSLKKQIDAMRRTIKSERSRDTKRISDAKKEVTKAQNSVNSLQSEINSSHNRIKTVKGYIKNKKSWYDKKPWYDKTWAWAEYAAYAAAKGSEISGLYAKIGGLETAKHTAVGTLEVAKQVLRGIEAGAKTFPIDADPRIVGLLSAHGTATGALTVASKTLSSLEKTIKKFPIDADVRVAGLITARTAATAALTVPQETLRALEATIKNFPIDADVRIAGLFTARDTANAALELAKLTLEGLKETVGAMAEVGEFIAKAGLGGLFDVKEAGFEGNLSVVNSGSVSLSTKIVFMNKESEHTFTFNFFNPAMGIRALVQELVSA